MFTMQQMERLTGKLVCLLCNKWRDGEAVSKKKKKKKKDKVDIGYRERKTTETDRQTDRQTDREGETDRQTERDRERKGGTEREKKVFLSDCCRKVCKTGRHCRKVM